MAPDELKELMLKSLANLKLRARKHLPVLSENCIGNVQPGRFGSRKQEDGPRQPVWFQSRRNEDVSVDDEPERDHGFRFLSAGGFDYLLNLPGS